MCKFLILLLPFYLTSCYSYRTFPEYHNHLTNDKHARKAFVINPNLQKEYKILTYSGIYELTNDSLNDLKIRLSPVKKRFACGNPLIASLITLGQLPVLMPDYYGYEFQEIDKEKTTLVKYQLTVARRVWFWDMFKFKKHFEEKAGKSLLGHHIDSKKD